MSSTISTNNTNTLGKKRYLEVDREGVPLNKQVPNTSQIYTGAGNETITFDGSNVFVVQSTLAGGDLTITETDATMRNLLNRTIKVIIPSTTTNDTIINLPVGATFVSAGAENGNAQKTVAAAAAGVTFELVFYSVTSVGVL